LKYLSIIIFSPKVSYFNEATLIKISKEVTTIIKNKIQLEGYVCL